MKFKEFGEKAHPTVILLHREGLSWRSLKDVIRCLEQDYHVVAPVIDGDGEDGAAAFVSIQDSAKKLIRYIDADCHGNVLAIGGLCLGAQIAVEALSERADIARYAVLESASVCPEDGFLPWLILFWGLLCSLAGRLFAQIGRKRLDAPRSPRGQSCGDFSGIPERSVFRVAESCRSYALPDGIKKTRAKILLIVGTRELRRMDRSVRTLMGVVPGLQVCVSPGTRSGGFTLFHPEEYLSLVERFLEGKLS